MSATETMKPCPFCGETKIDFVHKAGIWCFCLRCGAEGPFANTESEAIAAWNRRAALAKHGA